MTKFRNVVVDIDVKASKEQAWDLLYNHFGEVNNFNPLIEGSHHSEGAKGEVGCERVCDLDAKNSIHEKIVAARDNESFDVDIIKGGLPMMDEAKATFDLKAKPSGANSSVLLNEARAITPPLWFHMSTSWLLSRIGSPCFW